MFTEMLIEKPVYIPAIELLMLGGFIAGGYPLFLCGGAADYTDIDVYAPNLVVHARLKDYLERQPHMKLNRTTRTQPYYVHGINQRFELVDQGFKDFTWQEVCEMADLSPSATALVWRDNRPRVMALYRDDISNHVCRVLEQHEWTAYRTESYAKKGYTIVQV